VTGGGDHPEWCAQEHHCTYPMRPHGHASVPEVFSTRIGRVIATRHGSSRRGHLEVRIVLPLPDATEAELEIFMRVAVATTTAALDRDVRPLRRAIWLAAQRREYRRRAAREARRGTTC